MKCVEIDMVPVPVQVYLPMLGWKATPGMLSFMDDSVYMFVECPLGNTLERAGSSFATLRHSLFVF